MDKRTRMKISIAKLLDKLEVLEKEATPGPWDHHKPGCCRAITYRDGVICQMMNDKVDMQDATGLAPIRKQADINMQLIVALRNAFPVLRAVLRGGVPENKILDLPWLVQYRRKDWAGSWTTMAAFDYEGPAKGYAEKCGGDEIPWEYRATAAPQLLPSPPQDS